ncbi:hypothetical protein [Oceanibaculum indicum]|uniref:Uncharacterized protein n=1 Tax=Oceanibaculum indicum TaxID=526216 RepID=A0A420WR10_9PROT|nr:hypothetical protein [Oceanibaculum indicum]RKQ73478.1 hypothetical protein BCL74_1267 [Oceanibaculum indicum]
MIGAVVASAASGGDPPRAENVRRMARAIAEDEARYGHSTFGLLQERGWSIEEVAELAEEATAMARAINAARRGTTTEGPRP